MSSGDDSETAEWEREQMLRGTQSRRQNTHQQRTEKSKETIDSALAKRYVNQDIERVQNTVESIKRSIGSTKLEIVKYEKRIESLNDHIRKLESSNRLFETLGTLKEPQDVASFIEKHQTVIKKLPHDQREMFDVLTDWIKTAQQPMDLD